jgi:hypothetical protein
MWNRSRRWAEGTARWAILGACLRPAAAHAEEGFVDLDGQWRPFQLTYWTHIAQPRGPPRYWLAAAEDAGWLALGLVYYWANPSLNRADWDQSSLSDRLTVDAFRFDNNNTITNHVIHPFAGSAYYGFARVNNLGPAVAAAYGFGSAFVWEYALEWREVVSVNDLVFTGIAGLPIGEFFFQMGEYATSAPNPGWIGSVLAATFGLPRTVHQAILDDEAPPPLPLDNLGLSSARAHRFLLAAHYGPNTNARSVEHLFGFLAEAEVVALPGYGRPGEFASTFFNGAFTEGELTLDTNSALSMDLDVRFEAVYLGRYWQAYTHRVGSSALDGHAGLVGLSTAVEYVDHRFEDHDDQVAITHLAGPALSRWDRQGPLWSRFDLRAFVDFAAIRSLGFGRWRLQNDVDGVKSVLVDQNYQFHLGGSARVRATAGYEQFSLGVVGSYGLYGGLEGLDREEEDVTQSATSREQIWDAQAHLGYRFDDPGLEVRYVAEAFGRGSEYASEGVRRWDLRNRLSVGLGF